MWAACELASSAPDPATGTCRQMRAQRCRQARPGPHLSEGICLEGALRQLQVVLHVQGIPQAGPLRRQRRRASRGGRVGGDE